MTVVREGPGAQRLLFAGTETSASVSFDDGDPIGATYGRAIWTLDDIAALAQMRADKAGQAVHLER